MALPGEVLGIIAKYSTKRVCEILVATLELPEFPPGTLEENEHYRSCHDFYYSTGKRVVESGPFELTSWLDFCNEELSLDFEELVGHCLRQYERGVTALPLTHYQGKLAASHISYSPPRTRYHTTHLAVAAFLDGMTSPEEVELRSGEIIDREEIISSVGIRTFLFLCWLGVSRVADRLSEIRARFGDAVAHQLLTLDRQGHDRLCLELTESW